MPAATTRGRTYGRAGNEPRPRSDAYTGLLLLSLLAQIAGILFLVIDWHSYPSTSPPQAAPLAASAGPSPAPQGGAPTPAVPPAGAGPGAGALGGPMAPGPAGPMPPKMP